jgi:precorrin-3B C17-methyltransferase
VAEGRLFLVGIGPGDREQMSERARQAIAAADVVVGYRGYLGLIADLLAGKEVVAMGMTEELERVAAAYERAGQGRSVALISSGDVGIYGMAGPAYEWLLAVGWRAGRGPAVEVVPGITALSACAALVGAPLSHDFCAVSLSDLLTPWPVIARRLDAAARADFVLALYNPKSRRRQGQIVAAQRILLRHRDPLTPVAIVESAYRAGQAVRHVPLAEMAASEMGMLATVLVGNSQTRWRDGLMVTPRGYAEKYRGPGGAVRPGEVRGHSLRCGLTGWQADLQRESRPSCSWRRTPGVASA